MNEIKCLCIDVSRKPIEIPKKKWLELKQQYTAVALIRDKNGVLGIQVAEIDLDESCAPYEMFAISRFLFKLEDMDSLAELGKLCSTMDFDTPIMEQLERELLIE